MCEVFTCLFLQCAPETEKAKKRSSLLKFGVNKDNICDCNQEHDGKPKQIKLENTDVSLHVHSPKSSMRAIKRFEDHCMDKETSAFSLNKALHNVWKKRKAMCKELVCVLFLRLILSNENLYISKHVGL